MVRIIGFNGSPFEDDSTCGKILKVALSGAEKEGAETESICLRKIITEQFHGIHNPAQLAMASVYRALPSFLKRSIPEAAREFATEQLMPEAIKNLIRKIEAADGVIFASPTWWSMPSGYIVTLLDYMTLCDYRGYSLRGKVAGLIAVCEEDGGGEVVKNMQYALSHMGFLTPPFCCFFFNRKLKESEENWQETDQVLVGANVARTAKLMKNVSWDWRKA
jgi:multimeric flavodoxin WrbA